MSRFLRSSRAFHRLRAIAAMPPWVRNEANAYDDLRTELDQLENEEWNTEEKIQRLDIMSRIIISYVQAKLLQHGCLDELNHAATAFVQLAEHRAE